VIAFNTVCPHSWRRKLALECDRECCCKRIRRAACARMKQLKVAAARRTCRSSKKRYGLVGKHWSQVKVKTTYASTRLPRTLCTCQFDTQKCLPPIAIVRFFAASMLPTSQCECVKPVGRSRVPFLSAYESAICMPQQDKDARFPASSRRTCRATRRTWPFVEVTAGFVYTAGLSHAKDLLH
jgi:hypothetical protein